MRLPRSLLWLFWDVDAPKLDVERDRDFILARVLERGRFDDVLWALHRYGKTDIHAFLRDHGNSELSARTLAFWRVVLRAKEETWAKPRRFRETNVARWRT